MQCFEVKVVVFIGVGSGIGWVLVLMFVVQGVWVVVIDLQEEVVLVVVQEIVEVGGSVIVLWVDVGVEDDLWCMVVDMLQVFGQIDVLFNNVVNKNLVIVCDVDFFVFNEELFYCNMWVNVFGGVLVCKYVLLYMLEWGQGLIIFILLISLIVGEVVQFSYGVLKVVLNWYVQSIVVIFGKCGVCCNVILLGVICILVMESWVNVVMQMVFLDIYNVLCFGELEDIVGMVLYLVLDELCYVNGVLLCVDGGMSCIMLMVLIVCIYF